MNVKTPPTETSHAVRGGVLEVLWVFEKPLKQRVHLEDRLDQFFKRAQLAGQDRAFASYLAYGVVRHWLPLTHAIDQLSHFPQVKLDPTTRLLLKLGVFQLAKMDSVPDYAAVSSTLELAEALKCTKKTRAVIHGILSAFIRQGKTLSEDLALAYPAWFVARLKSQWAADALQQIHTGFSALPQLTLRVNTLVTSVEAFKAAYEAQAILLQPTRFSDVFVLPEAHGVITDLPGYTEGWFAVQDVSSAAVAYTLNPAPGERVLEIGAAPGSKTLHLAALMQNQGEIVAVDSSEKRLLTLQANVSRLQASMVTPLVADGRQLPKDIGLFDKILVDAPCSGTGTIGKHPEILFHLKPDDFDRFAAIQRALLTHVLTFLKPGGTLVYSTCSIDETENAAVWDTFVQSNSSVQPVLVEKLLPGIGQDGFFIATLKMS